MKTMRIAFQELDAASTRLSLPDGLSISQAQRLRSRRLRVPFHEDQELARKRMLVVSRKVDQADNAGVRMSSYDNEFTKILIQGYKDATFGGSSKKNFTITGVSVPITNPNSIMTNFLQLSFC